jgi:Protein of unknown function (DUF3632)
MRDGLEQEHELGVEYDAWISGATQWILWNGHSLFKQVLYRGDVPEDTRKWNPGKLYDGKPLLTLHRWTFWKERFIAISESDDHGEECRNLSGRAAALMDCIEKQLTFTGRFEASRTWTAESTLKEWS